ncbi:MAG: 50S ribosomal protein L23 [Patescibacteria group bacterium]|nr:50S ribosomal protein L23 [Patescibacteria group bacterium]
MGIFDRIIGKKEEKKSAEKTEKEKRIAAAPGDGKPKTVKVEKKRAEKKSKVEKPKKESRSKKVAKKEENRAHSVLTAPLVSEKSTVLGQYNKYVFRVSQKANKNEIKSAIEDYYGVGVTKVNIVKIHPKKRMHGRTVGWKQGFKKAIVTLQEGDTIGVAEGV